MEENDLIAESEGEDSGKKKGTKRRSRTSRVSRLPRAVRDKVNQMLDDGFLYKDIIKMVKEETGVELNHQHLSTWYHGGHERWQAERLRVQDMRETREFVREEMRESQGKEVAEAGLKVAASQLYEILVKFNVAGLKRELKKQPEAYPKVVQMLARVSEGGLKYERHRAGVEKDKAKVEREEAEAKAGGVSKDALDDFRRALRLL
jgi:hypothetical protein